MRILSRMSSVTSVGTTEQLDWLGPAGGRDTVTTGVRGLVFGQELHDLWGTAVRRNATHNCSVGSIGRTTGKRTVSVKICWHLTYQDCRRLVMNCCSVELVNAEGVRFELTKDLTPRQFSRLVPSTARPTLQTAIVPSCLCNGKHLHIPPSHG